MAEIEARLAELGIELPDTPSPIANYVPGVRTGNLVYLSGLGPASRPDGTIPSGKVGRDLTTEEGYEAARLTGVPGRLEITRPTAFGAHVVNYELSIKS